MLFQSKAFWTAIVDLVVSVIMWFGAKYLTPDLFEDAKFLVVALQPIAALVIAHYATAPVKEEVESLNRQIRSLQK